MGAEGVAEVADGEVLSSVADARPRVRAKDKECLQELEAVLGGEVRCVSRADLRADAREQVLAHKYNIRVLVQDLQHELGNALHTRVEHVGRDARHHRGEQEGQSPERLLRVLAALAQRREKRTQVRGRRVGTRHRVRAEHVGRRRECDRGLAQRRILGRVELFDKVQRVRGGLDAPVVFVRTLHPCARSEAIRVAKEVARGRRET